MIEDLWGVPVVSISATGALPPDIPKKNRKPRITLRGAAKLLRVVNRKKKDGGEGTV